jgi:mRNA-degrading endonuclease toxin of MazEF toxin-antitoxin module
VVKLPQGALAQLGQLRAAMVARGEVFWLPGTVVVYRASDKRRPCLVAALDNARAHLIPGTSQRATGPAVVVEAGETDLLKRTEFDFSVSFPLALTDLVARGQPAGALAADRLAEIDAAIAASNLVALKRLLRS